MELPVDCSFILDGVAIIPDMNPFTFLPVFAVLNVITKQTIESSFETFHRAGSYYVLRQRVPHIDNPVSEEICTDPASTVTFFKLQTMSNICFSIWHQLRLFCYFTSRVYHDAKKYFLWVWNLNLNGKLFRSTRVSWWLHRSSSPNSTLKELTINDRKHLPKKRKVALSCWPTVFIYFSTGGYVFIRVWLFISSIVTQKLLNRFSKIR